MLTHLLLVSILCVDNQLTALKELISNKYCLIKEAARVATKVKNKVCHTLLAEGIYCALYLAM